MLGELSTKHPQSADGHEAERAKRPDREKSLTKSLLQVLVCESELCFVYVMSLCFCFIDFYTRFNLHFKMRL